MWDSVEDLVHEALEILASVLQAKWSTLVDVKSEKGNDGGLPLSRGAIGI